MAALPPTTGVEATAQQILAHFSTYTPAPEIQFHVAGYDSTASPPEQHVWSVNVSAQQVARLNKKDVFGANWGGEIDILVRLVQRAQIMDSSGNSLGSAPYFQIPWPFFTLQDAIDFAFFAVDATIAAIRFQPRPKTVGGPVDVLVIKPDGPRWIRRKELGVPKGG
jgi:hypothetical protein